MVQETRVVRTIGRYQAIEEIGRGAMGVVFKGFDPVIGRPLALKTIAIAGNDESARDFRNRLYREATAAGTLSHTNIVTIYDVVEEGDTTAIAMEFVEGESLEAIVKRQAPLPVAMALDLLTQVCAAIDYAGRRGIVHRDIKPANILVTHEGHVKVADFGIARITDSRLTRTGLVLGSPSYMSPEQVRGETVDSRSDVFSAAVTFYEMLTGQLPFAGSDIATTMYRIVHIPPTPPGSLNPAIGEEVSAVLERALAKQPGDRYATGADLVRALGEAITSHTPREDLRETRLANEPLLAAPAATVAAPLAADAPAGDAVATISAPVGRAREAPWRRSPALTGGLAALVVIGLALAGVRFLAGGGASAGGPKDEPQARPESGTAVDPGAAVQPARTPPGAASLQPATNAASAASRVGTAPRDPAVAPVASSRATTDVPGGSAGRPGSTPRGVPSAADLGFGSEATLEIEFEGGAYPVTLFSGNRRLGVVDAATGRVSVEAGPVRLRAVSEAAFLDQDLGTFTLKAGEHRKVGMPAAASAVFDVAGDVYAGLQMSIDGRPVPGPYPAQLKAIAAGDHTVRYSWVTGPAAGKELSQAVTLTAGGHFRVRAVPDNGQVVLQQLR